VYAILAASGLAFFHFMLPETRGVSLEETETLFDGRNGDQRERRKSGRISVAYSRISNPLDNE